MIKDEEKNFFHNGLDCEEAEGNDEGVVAPADDPGDEADR